MESRTAGLRFGRLRTIQWKTKSKSYWILKLYKGYFVGSNILFSVDLLENVCSHDTPQKHIEESRCNFKILECSNSTN